MGPVGRGRGPNSSIWQFCTPMGALRVASEGGLAQEIVKNHCVSLVALNAKMHVLGPFFLLEISTKTHRTAQRLYENMMF